MRIYVAGAATEAELVAGYIRRLGEAGHAVTLDWTGPVREVLASGRADRDMDECERARHASIDLDAVHRCVFFWLIVPSSGGRGAWVELGTAITSRKHVVVSGDWRASIFCELAHKKFDAHDDALRWLCSFAATADCSHECFCGTDDTHYVMCEDCSGLFDAIDVASHMTERLHAAKERIAALERRLRDQCVDQACDRTWCQLCRTRDLHLHAVGCILDRWQR